MFSRTNWQRVALAAPLFSASAAAAALFVIVATVFAGVVAGLFSYASFPSARADSGVPADKPALTGSSAKTATNAASKPRLATMRLSWLPETAKKTSEGLNRRTDEKITGRARQDARRKRLAAKILAARAETKTGSKRISLAKPAPAIKTNSTQSQQTFTTVCVRHCDGFFYQINQSAKQDDFANDEAKCWSSCDVPTSLYVFPTDAGSLETMIDSLGRRYRESETAFLFRTAYKPICSCTGNSQAFSARSQHSSGLTNQTRRASTKKSAKQKTVAALDQSPLHIAKALSDETSRTIPPPITKPKVTKLIKRLLKRAKLKAEKEKSRAIEKINSRKKSTVKRKVLPKKMALKGKSKSQKKKVRAKITKKPAKKTRPVKTANEIIMATMWSHL